MALQKKFKYTSLVVFWAIALSTMGGYFSVYGIGLMFFSKFTEVSIMAIILETLKVITVGMLSLYWEQISGKIKFYLTLAVIVLSFVTSLGIYSFLSSSFQESNNKMEVTQKQSEIYLSKKQTFLNGISQIEKDLKLKNDRITTLNNLRANQEKRLDDVTLKSKYSTQQSIKSADNQIIGLQKYVDTLNTKSLMLADSVSKYEIKIIDLEKTQATSSDVGTFKFLSQISGIEMNRIVNWLILLLLLVFDPLAITLIIASSKISKIKKEVVEVKNAAEESFKNKLKQEYISDEQGNFKLQSKEIDIQKQKKKSILNKFKNYFTKKVESSVEDIEIKAEPPTEDIEIKEPIKENMDLQIEQDVIAEVVKEKEDIEKTTVEDESEAESVVIIAEEKKEEHEQVITEEVNAIDADQDKVEDTHKFNVNHNTIVENVFTATTETTSIHSEPNYPSESMALTVENTLKRQTLYLQLLQIFYKNGKKVIGDEISSYVDLKKMIQNELPNVNEKDIKDFLLICNLFKITEFKGSFGYFEKEYAEAVNLISKI